QLPRIHADACGYGPSAARGTSGAQWKWYAASLIVPAVAVLGFWLLKPSHPRLTLSATDMGGQLRIAWDGADRSIGHAKSGSIEIDDHGVRTQVNLTPADLRFGSLFYERQSGDVAVRLTVDVPGSPPVVETTRFLRPGQSATAPAPPPPQARRPETLPPSLRPPALAKSARRVIPFRAPNKNPRPAAAAHSLRKGLGEAPPKVERKA